MGTTRVTAGQKYLAGWIGVEGSSRCALDPLGWEESCHANLTVLTQLGYYVSINGKVGNYFVRCLPVRSTPYHVGQGMVLSYCGPDLNYILACAAYEADLLNCTPDVAVTAEAEAPRWAMK